MFKEFIEIAKDEIETIKHKDCALEEEENAIKERLNEIMEMRSKLVINDEALASYISTCTSNPYICPSCFIREGEIVELRPVPSDNGNDVFECPHCSIAIEVKT